MHDPIDTLDAVIKRLTKQSKIGQLAPDLTEAVLDYVGHLRRLSLDGRFDAETAVTIAKRLSHAVVLTPVLAEQRAVRRLRMRPRPTKENTLVRSMSTGEDWHGPTPRTSEDRLGP